MKVQDWGEEGIIQYLVENFPSQDSLIGIGDDCAVIPQDQSDQVLLITEDALVEGVHFLKEQISPFNLGYKTIAVNVSDIVAMGGVPKYAFLSIALPKLTEKTWLCDVLQGIKEACGKWDIQLLGGDTVGSKRDVFLSLTLIGAGSKDNIKYRHQAIPGDVVCVTGYLGDAIGGFQALQEGISKSKEVESLIRAHFQPEPHVKQGCWLGSQSGVHAMMDVSDGFACDIKRLMRSSKTGVVIETQQIPISKALREVSVLNKWDALRLALTGGEDYCLLLTVSPDAFEKIRRGFEEAFLNPLYEVGRVTDQANEIIYNVNEKPIQMNFEVFDHFQ